MYFNRFRKNCRKGQSGFSYVCGYLSACNYWAPAKQIFVKFFTGKLIMQFSLELQVG